MTMFCLLEGGRSLHEFQFQVSHSRRDSLCLGWCGSDVKNPHALGRSCTPLYRLEVNLAALAAVMGNRLPLPATDRSRFAGVDARLPVNHQLSELNQHRDVRYRLILAFGNILLEVEEEFMDAVNRTNAVAHVLPTSTPHGFLIASGALEPPEERAVYRSPRF